MVARKNQGQADISSGKPQALLTRDACASQGYAGRAWSEGTVSTTGK